MHRDVKPGNILVRTDGMVKLTDFGIAKAADAVPVTRSGMVMGTAHYIAPEQASGAEAGPAGDVYSLGIVGYECLAGHRPFRAESAVAVAMMQVRDQPPPLPASVPPHARELIEAVLVKDPTQRYSTGGEFAAAVAAVRRGERLPAPGSLIGPFTPPAGPARPHAAARRGGADPDAARPRRRRHADPVAPDWPPRRRRPPLRRLGRRRRPGGPPRRSPPGRWSSGRLRARPHVAARAVRAAHRRRRGGRCLRGPQPGRGADAPGHGARYRGRPSFGIDTVLIRRVTVSARPEHPSTPGTGCDDHPPTVVRAL